MGLRKIEKENEQGVNEKVYYQLTTTNWGVAPVSVSVNTVDVTANYADVSQEVQSGDATVEGDTITLPEIRSLKAGHVYRVAVRFSTGGNVFEPYFVVYATR